MDSSWLGDILSSGGVGGCRSGLLGLAVLCAVDVISLLIVLCFCL